MLVYLFAYFGVNVHQLDLFTQREKNKHNSAL